MFRIENNGHMLEITCQVAFLMLFKLFGTCSLKVVRTSFVWNETWHTTLISIYYGFELVGIENNSHMLEITCKVAFLMFFKVFLWHLLA